MIVLLIIVDCLKGPLEMEGPCKQRTIAAVVLLCDCSISTAPKEPHYLWPQHYRISHVQVPLAVLFQQSCGCSIITAPGERQTRRPHTVARDT